LAVKQEERWMADGLRLRWAERARRAGGLCRAAVQDGGGLADFY
jgi:hypothetical protein